MDQHVEAGSGGVWVTCADLANRKGVSRQAVGKRVDQLERDGKITTRREGRSRLVDLAAYDRVVGEVGDAVKEQAAETARGQQSASPAMRDAQTQRAQYEARLKALDLAERQGQLVPIGGAHGIEAASLAIGQVLARELDALPRHADEIAVAVSKEGVAGVRRILKEIGTKTRASVAGALNEIATLGCDAEQGGPIETLLPDE